MHVASGMSMSELFAMHACTYMPGHRRHRRCYSDTYILQPSHIQLEAASISWFVTVSITAHGRVAA
jgi:hypothetical protein